jgi:hypothetical protein
LNAAEAFRGESLREEDDNAMKDLRDYIATCEKEGKLRRVKAEVDWDLEISHICKVIEEKSGPALLFENVKGYKSPVLTEAFATTKSFWTRRSPLTGKSNPRKSSSQRVSWSK